MQTGVMWLPRVVVSAYSPHGPSWWADEAEVHLLLIALIVRNGLSLCQKIPRELYKLHDTSVWFRVVRYAYRIVICVINCCIGSYFLMKLGSCFSGESGTGADEVIVYIVVLHTCMYMHTYIHVGEPFRFSCQKRHVIFRQQPLHGTSTYLLGRYYLVGTK